MRWLKPIAWIPVFVGVTSGLCLVLFGIDRGGLGYGDSLLHFAMGFLAGTLVTGIVLSILLVLIDLLTDLARWLFRR
jgi:hypothetical protein